MAEGIRKPLAVGASWIYPVNTQELVHALALFICEREGIRGRVLPTLELAMEGNRVTVLNLTLRRTA